MVKANRSGGIFRLLSAKAGGSTDIVSDYKTKLKWNCLIKQNQLQMYSRNKYF